MEEPPKARPSILIVDDDPAVREAVHLILDARYDMLETGDGDQVLPLIQAHPVDLVLLDILIDGIDGITLLGRLRERHPQLPVIMISGLNTAWTATAALQLGAVDYIPKPFDVDRLLSAVETALRLGAAMAELNTIPAQPHLLLIGFPVDTAASLIAALSAHARMESLPANTELFVRVPPISPDVVVIDFAGVALDSGDLLTKIGVRFPLAPIVALSPPRRRAALTVGRENRAVTVLSKPVNTCELLKTIGMELHPSVVPMPRLSPKVLKIIEYFCANLATATLQGLGGALGTRPYYLSVLFHRETGLTLRAYLQRTRVEAARQLLLETTDKLETLAMRVGLNSGSHLSRLFLKYSHCRPGHFRRAYVEGPEQGPAAKRRRRGVLRSP